MQKNSLVSALMTPSPLCVSPTDTMQTVHNIFHENAFHHLPVTDQVGRLVGIVSYTNYMRAVRSLFNAPGETSADSRFLSSILVQDVMTDTHQLIALDTKSTLIDALRLFKANRFHAIPVISQNHKLEGILSVYDLLRAFEQSLE